jgi:hypothetical protein
MGFVVRQSNNRSHGWISKPMQPANDGETGPRGFVPRSRAAVFATREEAQREIDAIQPQSGMFKFEIQSD